MSVGEQSRGVRSCPASGLGLLLWALLSVSCSPRAPRVMKDYLNDPAYPQDFWETSTCEAEGIDEGRLLEVFSGGDGHNDIVGFLVIRNGRLVFERYGYDPDSVDKNPFGYGAHQVTPTELRHLQSTTKSFTSALIGIAIAEGRIAGVGSAVLPFFSDLQIRNVTRAKTQMTIADLLTMQSGLAWDEDGDDAPMVTSSDPVQYLLDKPMSADPGTRWLYCTGCSHLLTAALQRAIGKTAEAYAVEKLFEPMGIGNHVWWSDPKGVTIGGWGLSLTARDLAKLGYLYLNHGNWKGTQLIPQAWIEESTRSHAAAYGNVGYGYQWWTYPDIGGFGTQGAFGQDMFVLPAQNMVVVFNSNMPDAISHDVLARIVRNYVIPAAK